MCRPPRSLSLAREADGRAHLLPDRLGEGLGPLLEQREDPAKQRYALAGGRLREDGEGGAGRADGPVDILGIAKREGAECRLGGGIDQGNGRAATGSTQVPSM